MLLIIPSFKQVFDKALIKAESQTNLVFDEGDVLCVTNSLNGS